MSARMRLISSARPSVATYRSRSVDTGGLLTVCPPRPLKAVGRVRCARGLRLALAGAGARSRFTDSKPCIMSRYKPLVRSDLTAGQAGQLRPGTEIGPDTRPRCTGPACAPVPRPPAIASHETSNGGEEGLR